MPWKDLIFHNFGWKVLSFLLAVQIWYNIHSGIEENVTLKRNIASTVGSGLFARIRVQVLEPPGSTGAYKLNPSTVDITLTGDFDLLQKLGARDVMAFIQTTGSSDETNAFSAQVQVLPPPGMSVKLVVPQNVSVERIMDSPREQPAKSK